MLINNHLDDRKEEEEEEDLDPDRIRNTLNRGHPSSNTRMCCILYIYI